MLDIICCKLGDMWIRRYDEFGNQEDKNSVSVSWKSQISNTSREFEQQLNSRSASLYRFVVVMDVKVTLQHIFSKRNRLLLFFIATILGTTQRQLFHVPPICVSAD